jgi:Asp-tRNA(Asn)/Glu-tRNA(Gln) amidotransferase A subunit family amidase
MSGVPFTRRQVLAAAAATPLSLALAKVAGAAGAVAPHSTEASSTNPADLSIVELMPLLQGGQLAARELVEACIDRVEHLDPEIKAFERPTFDVALAGAKAVDEARAAGRPVGPLAGVPIGLKDLYYTKGIPTTASSKVLEDFVPDYDATVWARLQAAGMVLLGKLRMAEFAMSGHTPPTVNPWDTMRSPGGSSGGSGAALAARMLPAALGSDTGGSIRIPSAVCGVAGLKPTYGRFSRHGGIPLGWSLDHMGPMARRMTDCALLLQVMARGGRTRPIPPASRQPCPTIRPPRLPAWPGSASASLTGSSGRTSMRRWNGCVARDWTGWPLWGPRSSMCMPPHPPTRFWATARTPTARWSSTNRTS